MHLLVFMHVVEQKTVKVKHFLVKGAWRDGNRQMVNNTLQAASCPFSRGFRYGDKFSCLLHFNRIKGGTYCIISQSVSLNPGLLQKDIPAWTGDRGDYDNLRGKMSRSSGLPFVEVVGFKPGKAAKL